MSHKLNSGIAVIGIDIGKNSFHVVGLDQRGAIVLRQKWSRGQVATRLASMPRCLTPSAELAWINNNIASAWPWVERIRARGSTGSDCKIRGCRRSPPARTFRRLAVVQL